MGALATVAGRSSEKSASAVQDGSTGYRPRRDQRPVGRDSGRPIATFSGAMLVDTKRKTVHSLSRHECTSAVAH